MKTFIIIDDEPLAHDIIENYCSMIPNLELKKNCYSAIEAMFYLSEHKVDFMFLDIKMPKLKGFDFLRTLANPPKVIVTTAYKEYAIEGYELNVVDYLLKPFSFERMLTAVNKVITTKETPTEISRTHETDTERFFIKTDKKHVQINLADILFIEAYGNYCKIHLSDGETLVNHDKISNFETLLPKTSFLRVHKSYIVAVAKISSIEGNRIHLSNQTVPIGQTYKSAVTAIMKP